VALLEVNQVSKHFGGLVANQEVSFALEQHEMLGLIGPNGAGKTTLFNCIAGFYPVTSGRIIFDGRDITALRDYQTARLGLARTFQIFQASGDLKVLENVMVGSFLRTGSRRKARQTAEGCLDFLGIRAAAGGLTATQRAQQVAQRLQGYLQTEQQVAASDFRVAQVNGEWAVLAADTILITADTYQAALNRTTPQRLANIWRDNIAGAVTAQVAGFRGEAERTSSKIVPIVSLGSGIRVGAAQITGPAANVAQASVVGQVETTFQDVVRIRIFVPLQSVTNIQRVPQVNVSAYGDIRL
jgi:ABC-type branched-subunit amino acid transport system ATPase component